MNGITLHHRDYGTEHSASPAIVLLHGFLGSGTNWHSIARKLSESWRVVVPDLRGHGQSPHARPIDYASMANDLAALLDSQGLDEVILVGHSMGGKVAMEFALRHPTRVAKLVVVDIAPVRYRHDFAEIFAGMRAVDLEAIGNRRDAEAMMDAHIAEPGIRQFLLQNLEKGESGWQWRIDLDLLQAAVPQIQSAPPAIDGGRYGGPILVIHGERSNYVQPMFEPIFARHFPTIRYAPIAEAGHWVYAERPEAFMAELQAFLEE